MAQSSKTMKRRDFLKDGVGILAALGLAGSSGTLTALASDKTVQAHSKAAGKTLLISDPHFANHDPGRGHPERPDRVRVLDQVFQRTAFDGLTREQAPLRDDLEEAILRAHKMDFYNHIKSSKPSHEDERVRIDPDTVMSLGSWEAALRAIGAGMTSVDRVMDETTSIKNTFCQVRPPGHHAETQRAMGFCIFNSVAIAGLYAREKFGAERIAVVDFDVHHGNGTQEIFWSDKNLFFGSTHQIPLFPGTGELNETGAGNIFNGPLSPGNGGDEFRQAFSERILVNLNDFQPDIILISAGFDAHKDDPLASLQLEATDFGWATEELMVIAERHCKGRIVSMLEGGYDLNALAESAAVHVKALMGV